MKSNGSSRYSISMDNGNTYTQEDIEDILTSLESLKDFTNESLSELKGEDNTDGCIVAESQGSYGWRRKRRKSISVEEAIQFLDDCGTYEIAVFVSLMFHRCLGDRMPDYLKRKLDAVVGRLSDKRIVPVKVNYFGKGSMNIGNIGKVNKLNI